MRMKRYKVIALILTILIFLVSSPPAQAGNKHAANTSYQVFVGTYTGPSSKGIYGFHFDPATGQARLPVGDRHLLHGIFTEETISARC